MILSDSFNKKTLWILASLIILIGMFSSCAGTRQTQLKSSAPVVDFPSDAVVNHVIKASVYEAQGDLHSALFEYNQALMRDSSRVNLYEAIAEMYQRLSEFDSAKLVLESGIKRIGNDKTLLVFLGEVDYKLNNYEDAKKSYKALTEIDPTEVKYWGNLAAINERLGLPLEAVECYNQLKAIDNSRLDMILGRQGTLLTGAGKPEEAIKIYNELKLLRPTAHMVPFMIGGLYLDMGDTLKASRQFHEALMIEPHEDRYWDLHIRLEMILGNDEYAESQMDSAIVYNPESLNLLDLASAIFIGSNRTEDAERTILKTVELDSSNIDRKLNLGYFYHEQAEWDKAEAQYKLALQLDPSSAQTKNNYAYMLAVSGKDIEKALTFISEALEVEPENPSYLDTKGWLLYKLGDYVGSIDFLQRALSLDANNIEILDHLGDVYEANGNSVEAKKHWEQALEINSDNELIREKLANLR
jgi:tetratricopeptide (TPR) repeat protein